MRYAIVENGIVVNVVLAESALNASFIESEAAQIGDTYENGAFSTPAPVIPVPIEVTPAQFRRALNQLNYRNMVEAAVAQADQDTNDMWEYSLSLHRDNPLLTGMAEQLEIDSATLDNVFILAGSL
jgi:hypothetical protein